MTIPIEYYAMVPIYKTFISAFGTKIYIKDIDNVGRPNESCTIIITEKNGNKEHKAGVPTKTLQQKLVNENWKTFIQPLPELIE